VRELELRPVAAAAAERGSSSSGPALSRRVGISRNELCPRRARPPAGGARPPAGAEATPRGRSTSGRVTATSVTSARRAAVDFDLGGGSRAGRAKSGEPEWLWRCAPRGGAVPRNSGEGASRSLPCSRGRSNYRNARVGAPFSTLRRRGRRGELGVVNSVRGGVGALFECDFSFSAPTF
jgi:hypothetical protein